MKNDYYIKRLDELNTLFHDIYYEFTDTIDVKTPPPTLPSYREKLELATVFLPYLKKDFPEHSALVDTVWTDYKDSLEKLANDKTFHLAAATIFAAGQSLQALTAAMIEKKKNEPAGNQHDKGRHCTLKQFIENNCELPKGAGIESKVDLIYKLDRKNTILPKPVAEWKSGKPKIFYEDDLKGIWPSLTKEIYTLFPLKQHTTKE
jgi:hypothetical protein